MNSHYTDVSAAKQEALPSVTQDMLATLLDLAPDALLVVDSTGAIIQVNAQMEALFGYIQHELVGQPLELLLPERLRRLHAVHFERYLRMACSRPMGLGLDLVGRCKDGCEVAVDVSLRPILLEHKLHVMGAMRDATEQRRLQRLAQEVQAENNARLHLLQLILDHISAGICLLQGPQLRLLMANRAAITLWGAKWPPGLAREEFVRKHGVQFLAPSGEELTVVDSPVYRAMLSGEPILHAQVVIRQPDGTHLPTLLDTIPLENLHLFARLPQEMTAVLAPAERIVMVAHYDVSVLKEAERLKDQFIGLVTHELRTPVTIIAGCADILLRRAMRGKNHPLDEWQISRLGEVKHATQQLAHLTEDMFGAMRMQSGQFHLDRCPTDLVVLIQQVVERLQTTTTRHQFSLHIAPAHLWVMADAVRIEQVLSNLLSNAIKYSPQGGPIEVTLSEEKQRQEARLSVRDHGIGIPREQYARIFGRFMRADNGPAAGIRGTGLGLYLSRELVERHGGHISFESEEGEGSTFFVTLPLARL
ncbi:MAG TPA: PAS domain-containing sensor histidine kinase [Ktedonosporobacter sp.]|jgi:PAS domain S-box-containing protein|nr:PAS domain-containing sensor histidine kinase [Ktedonosporobacter sp.]